MLVISWWDVGSRGDVCSGMLKASGAASETRVLSSDRGFAGPTASVKVEIYVNCLQQDQGNPLFEHGSKQRMSLEDLGMASPSLSCFHGPGQPGRFASSPPTAECL